jgi:hypothetical protein
MRILIDIEEVKKVTVSAHNQLAVYEEGRGDGHPEADALVHVQLICGLACDAVERLRRSEEH